MSSDATNRSVPAGDTDSGDHPPGFTPSRPEELRRMIADLLSDGGPFASVYTEISRETTSGPRAVELHVREATDQLSGQGAPAAVVDAVRHALAENAHLPAPVSRCVVASERGVLLRHTVRTHQAQPTIVWDPLPDLGAWLTDVTESAIFVAALVDHEGGTVTTYDAGTMRPTHSSEIGEEKTAFEHHFKGGGWSHMNFQRSTEQVWARNAEEVITEIGRQAGSGVAFVVVGGEADSRAQVLAAKDDWPVEGIELEAGHPDDHAAPERFEQEIHRILASRAMQHRLAAVHELQQRRGRNQYFVTGVDAVLDALIQGQVDRLLIDPDAAAGETVVGSEHPGLSLGAVGGTGPLRADRLLVAMAAATDAGLVITRSSTLDDAPVAALLRW